MLIIREKAEKTLANNRELYDKIDKMLSISKSAHQN